MALKAGKIQKTTCDMIVYKKAVAQLDRKTASFAGMPCIVRMVIPRGTFVYKNVDNDGKCRTESAIVIGIEDLKGKTITPYRTRSFHTSRFTYTVGKTVKPVHRFAMIEVQCASGIHFYVTREGARKH